jgi:hypothetical protein
VKIKKRGTGGYDEIPKKLKNVLPNCLYICILNTTNQYFLHGGRMKLIRTLMIDSELLAQVDAYLEKIGKSNRSEFISECIREKLEKTDKKRKTA